MKTFQKNKRIHHQEFKKWKRKFFRQKDHDIRQKLESTQIILLHK